MMMTMENQYASSTIFSGATCVMQVSLAAIEATKSQLHSLIYLT